MVKWAAQEAGGLPAEWKEVPEELRRQFRRRFKRLPDGTVMDVDSRWHWSEAVVAVDELAAGNIVSRLMDYQIARLDGVIDRPFASLVSDVGRRWPVAATGRTATEWVLRAYIHDPRAMSDLHFFSRTSRSRKFESFQNGQGGKLGLPDLSPVRVQRFETDISVRGAERDRSRFCGIRVVNREDRILFRVRHGSLYRRVAAVRNDRVQSVGYRPVTDDTLVYVRDSGELQIHAADRSDVEFYRRAFGRVFFENPETFPEGWRYTLAPLRHEMAEALVCAHIDEIQSVRLRRIEWMAEGDRWCKTHHESPDLVEWMTRQGVTIPPDSRLLMATFWIRFRGLKRERRVTLRPPNVAIYARDPYAAALIRWWEDRGFLTPPGGDRIDAAARWE